MYIDFKELVRDMSEILTRTRTGLIDYQKDMCVLAYLVGKMQGTIDVYESQVECVKKQEEE